MDYEPDPDETRHAPTRRPHVTASERGAGAMGFTGAATTSETEQAAGLTELSGDSFGGGPTEPLLPGDWESRGRFAQLNSPSHLVHTRTRPDVRPRTRKEKS